MHVDDLLSELEAGQRGLETLKKRMKSVNEKKQPLDLPMSKPHAEQVHCFDIIHTQNFDCICDESSSIDF